MPSQPRRNFKNPWPRLSLVGFLTVWSGANLWSAIFRRQEILEPERANQFVGIWMTACFSLVPLVIAIYLLWTIVVGPEDPLATGEAGQRPNAQRSGKKTPAAKK